jgi:hypothetical protein
MNATWSYFWPCFAVGLVVGAVAGLIGFRRRSRRNASLSAGVLIALALAATWHGPLGGAKRFEARVERDIHATLDFYEMRQITAHLHHGPLTRRVMLSGPADDFQRSNLAQTLELIPGVENATWSADDGGLPLIVEGMAVSVVGFLLGLVLAYVAELRRRYNAQWNW